MRSITSVSMTAVAALAALVFIGTPAAIADTGNPTVAELEKTLVHIDVEFSGYVVYTDAKGVQHVSDEKTTVSVEGMCSGSIIDDQGDILTASHCFNNETVFDALFGKFQEDQMNSESDKSSTDKKPAASNPFEFLMRGVPTLTPIDAWGDNGAPEGMGQPIPRSAPDVKLTVWQRQYMDGAVLNQGPVVATPIGSVPTSQGDVAVIRIPVKTPHFLPVALQSPDFGETIWAAGYPGSVSEGLANGNPMQAASLMEGTVALNQPYDMGKPGMHVSATMGHAMSGGPVVKTGSNGKAVVVGVVSNGTNDGFNYASTTEDVRRLLMSNAIPFQDEQPPLSSLNHSIQMIPTNVVVLVAGALVFAMGCLVAIIVLVANARHSRRMPTPVMQPVYPPYYSR